MGRISMLLNISVVFIILLSKSTLASDNNDGKRELNCTAVLIEKERRANSDSVSDGFFFEFLYCATESA